MDYKLLMFEGLRRRFGWEKAERSSSPISPEEISGRGSNRFTRLITNPGFLAGVGGFAFLVVSRVILAPETLSTSPSQFLPLGVVADLAISTFVGSVVAIMDLVSKRISGVIDNLSVSEPDTRAVLDKYPRPIFPPSVD